MEEMTLSVIAVNYNSSSLLRECFMSLASAIGKEPFEFIAIDNGSENWDIDNLSNLKGDNVRIILNRENAGYARAANIGIRHANGDLILVTNPDVVYQHGSIKAMVNALAELPRCGAVGPRTWWDKGMTFLLPVSELIKPYRFFLTEIMRVSETMNHVLLKRWIRKTLRYWRTVKPLRQEMLSGACIMTTRKVLDRVGGFDESFPLYFEDTDWSLRVRKAGYNLYMVPDAQIIHYYNQSARRDMEAAQNKLEISLGKYIKKHFRLQQFTFSKILRLCRFRKGVKSLTYDDLGVLTSPPVFRFGDFSERLFLLSPLDSLIPSAGCFSGKDFFAIPGDLWDCLGDGRYFMKALVLNSFEVSGSWSWVKRTLQDRE